MNEIFHDMIAKGQVRVYIDDIGIANKAEDIEVHRQIVEEVLKRLQENDLYAKVDKCEFKQDSIENLGLILSDGKIEMDPKKLVAISEWPIPKKKVHVQEFLGLCNFNRKFIEGFGNISKPLTRLTGNGPWQWTEEKQGVFERLKEAFAKLPNLTAYVSGQPLHLEVDASGYATGAVLSQKQKESGDWKPLGFASKSFHEAERNYEIYDKEMLAIIRGMKEWKHLLQGSIEPFKVWSDHKNLEYWRTAQDLTRRQARWALFLSAYDFFITHKPGKAKRSCRCV